MARLLLRLATMAGLAVDVYVHWHLAPNFDSLKGSGSPSISQGELFRVEAVAALVVLVLVAVVHRRWTAAVAFLLLAGGTAVVVLYRYVDVGAIGPLPNMSDPTWYFEKTLSAVAEGVGAFTALVLFFLEGRGHRGHGGHGGHSGQGLRRRETSS